MSSDLHSLIYFSRNTVAGTPAERDAHIVQILASARRTNRQLGVTGALLFSQGCFAQVLEGEFGHVEAIFNRILPDPRHADLRVLQFTPIQARRFGDWAMAYADQSSAEYSRLDFEGLQDPARIANGDAGRDVVGVLRDMIHQYGEARAAG